MTKSPLLHAGTLAERRLLVLTLLRSAKPSPRRRCGRKDAGFGAQM